MLPPAMAAAAKWSWTRRGLGLLFFGATGQTYLLESYLQGYGHRGLPFLGYLGYHGVMLLAASAVFGWSALAARQRGQRPIMWSCAAAAGLFNPVAVFPLGWGAWQILMVVGGIGLLVAIPYLAKKPLDAESMITESSVAAGPAAPPDPQ